MTTDKTVERGKRLAAALRDDFNVGGILVQMAERGQLLKLRCEMPTCYCENGRGAFVRAEQLPFGGLFDHLF